MCMKSTRHCLPLTRVWSVHKEKEMSLSMRPLRKRKSLYYGCKVRNRAAIIFWEDKHMRKNLTEIVFILDRSGSMNGLERDTIGGFNSMIEQWKRREQNPDGARSPNTSAPVRKHKWNSGKEGYPKSLLEYGGRLFCLTQFGCLYHEPAEITERWTSHRIEEYPGSRLCIIAKLKNTPMPHLVMLEHTVTSTFIKTKLFLTVS